MENDPRPQPVNTSDYIEIQRFFADEAAILDRHAYREWFALVSADISYCVTTHVLHPAEDGAQEHAIIDENHQLLGLRVEQLSEPKLTRAENPRSLYRRMVSNVRAYHDNDPDSFSAMTNILIYKNRPSNRDVQIYAGERQDKLFRRGQTFGITSRLVRLDQTILIGGTLGTIF